MKRIANNNKLRLAMGVLIAALALAALGAAEARAAYIQSWPDGTITNGSAGCSTNNLYTWRYQVTDYIDWGRTNMSLADSPPSYFALAVCTVNKGWVEWDTSWTSVPKTMFGASATLNWRYGSGTFLIYAVFKHAGQHTAWVPIGKTTWIYDQLGRLGCYMTL